MNPPSQFSKGVRKDSYNSTSKPAQLRAHAYTQGTAIHVAPRQERNLPHEAWHVVQQKQGRVKPTLQMKGKMNINDNAELEREADVMGERANTKNGQIKSEIKTDAKGLKNGIIQGKFSSALTEITFQNYQGL